MLRVNLFRIFRMRRKIDNFLSFKKSIRIRKIIQKCRIFNCELSFFFFIICYQSSDFFLKGYSWIQKYSPIFTVILADLFNRYIFFFFFLSVERGRTTCNRCWRTPISYAVAIVIRRNMKSLKSKKTKKKKYFTARKNLQSFMQSPSTPDSGSA